MEKINGVLCIFSSLLILALGIYLTVKSNFLQLTRLLPSLKGVFVNLFKKEKKASGLSSSQAMCTALAATIGTGNVVGISGAIALAGPGVIFWVWVSSFFAMIIKYYEILMALDYREHKGNTLVGGTMYAVKNGLPKSFLPLAYVFAFCGVTASFGTGNFIQANTVTQSIKQLLPINFVDNKGAEITIGIIVSLFIGFLLISGVKSVGRACERIVPVMLLLYIAASLGVIFLNSSRLSSVFSLIIKGAFNPRAVTGGAVTAVFLTLQAGIIRGIVSNEAGLGTATVAHAMAEVKDKKKEGELGIAEVFIDTFICTLTAIVVLMGNKNIVYGADTGSNLILKGFANSYGNLSEVLLSVFLVLFGISSILGWGAYGISFCSFLWGKRGENGYKFLFSAACLVGAWLAVDKIWQISEILNSVMSLPNIIAVFLLTKNKNNCL